MSTLMKRLLPFLVIGMIITLFVFGIILFAYLFLIGSAIGCVLFAIQWIRNKLQSHYPSPTPSNTKSNKRKVRIIDIDDWKRH